MEGLGPYGCGKRLKALLAILVRVLERHGLEGVPATEALARLCSAAHLFVKVFQPSFKLAEKTRGGARVRKRHHGPETRCARLLASDAIPAVMKDRLRAVLGTVDPLGLRDEIREVQHHLAGLAAARRFIRCRSETLTSTDS